MTTHTTNPAFQKDLSHLLSKRVSRIKPSPTMAVAAKADDLIAKGLPIINLSIGEPDFDTPNFIKEAAITALNEGFTKYTAVDGTYGLKKAVIHKFARENHLHYELDQVIVSCGAKHSLSNLFTATLNPGDEVIIPAPYWVSYPDMVKLVDGEPVIVKTDMTQRFKMTPAQLKAAITDKTRLLILNSPSNPSGVAYTKDELHALGTVLLEYPNILVATDDIYEHTQWDYLPFANIVNACPELYERTVVVNGVSKSYAMTGFRIGYAGGPQKIIAAMKKIQSQTTSNPTSISQYAAEAALNGDQSCVSVMTHAYKARHDFLYAALSAMKGIKCIPSDGTFYAFPSIESFLNVRPDITDDIAFADFLLTQANIAVVPGSAFGTPGHIRFSYATSMENIKKAVNQLKAVLENFS